MNAWLIAQREIRSYLRSWLGAAVVAGMLLIDGLWFYANGLNAEKLLSAQVLQEFFYAASGTTMVGALLLSMRLVAEERQTGTLTLLTTSPISDGEIVIGKFLSVFAVILTATLVSLYMPLLIFVNGKVSVGHIAVGYLGIALLGSAAASIGLFASCLTRSQALALVVGAVILGVLLLLWLVARVVDPPLNDVLGELALHHEHQKAFMLGILDLRHVAYYLAVTFFFLLASKKALEARRWR